MKKNPIELGKSYFIDGAEGYQILCQVGHLNHGIGYLFPLVDDPENPAIATHICYAKINEQGKITLI